MIKTILCVVGMQCAGKTVLTSNLANSGTSVCYIGEEIRKRIDVTTFENTENPYAPQISESFAQEAIKNALDSFFKNEKSMLVIDSAPRNAEQLKILVEANRFINVVIAFVYEKYSIRLSRAVKKYDGKLGYFMKREQFENGWLKELVDICRNERLPIITVGES